ncbi:unnamed protein product [Moneuplotes crassus]|uniref:Lipoprotein n=1 Tax=Euplotes crassus TaxID=5936 RepID=A0AAD1U3T8_EUPCR|nr:unnamed protein product [Moneuplotes crassus]
MSNLSPTFRCVWLVIVICRMVMTTLASEGLKRDLQTTTTNFNFSSTSFSGLTYTDGGLTLTLDNAQIHDPDGGFLRIDNNNLVTITGSITPHPTDTQYPYTISAWIYLDRNDAVTGVTMFCLPLQGIYTSISASLITITCCGRIERNTDDFYIHFDCRYAGSSRFTRYTTQTIASNSSWHYFSYKFLARGASFAPTTSSDIQVEFWDDSGAPQVVDISTSSTSHQNIQSTYSIGFIYNGSSRVNRFSGLIYRLQISNFIEPARTGTRQDFISYAKDLYHLYFDLTSSVQNEHYGNTVRNLALVNKGGILTNTSIYIKEIETATTPTLVTNLGWITYYYTAVYETDLIQFDSATKYTFETDVFCYESYCRMLLFFLSKFMIMPYLSFLKELPILRVSPTLLRYSTDDVVGQTIIIGDGYTEIAGEDYDTYHRLPRNLWTKFILTVRVLSSTSQEICYYHKPIHNSSDSVGTPILYQNCTVISDVILEPTIFLRILSNRIIISNIKLFKSYLTSQSVELDYGLYQEAGDVKFEFSQNYSPYPASNTSTDVCRDLVTPNEVCQWSETQILTGGYYSYYSRRYIRYNYTQVSKICPDYYSPYGDYCYEDCGDGYISSSPQTMPCDDGNLANGDGCTDQCTVEDDYFCVITDLNKSYCRLKCGSGVYNPPDEQCDDNNNINGDGCDSNCNIETDYTCTHSATSPSYCIHHCGNGVRDFGEECDDNNSLSFDGCDNECKREFNYICNPDGSGVDVCVSEHFPPIITTNSHNTQLKEISYTFNDTMKNVSFTEEDIGCEFYGPSGDYTLQCNAVLQSDTQIKLKYSVSPAIIGGAGEILVVKLLKITSFKSSNLIPIATEYEYRYGFNTIEASEQAQAAGSGTSYTFIFSFAISLSISLLTGGSMELMWSLANTLQIVFILGLLNLYFPANLSAMFSYLKYSNFDNPVTEMLSSFALESISIISAPISPGFEELGFSSTSFLINSLDKIFLLLFLGLLVLFIYLLYSCLKKKSTWFAKKIKKMDSALRYESCTRLIVEMSMNLSVSIMINIFYGKAEGAIGISSYIFALCLLCFMILVAIYATAFPAYYYSAIKIYPEKFERHCFLFSEFKTSKPECLQYYSYFVIRRMLLAGVIVCLRQTNLLQLICVVVLFYSVCKYQLIYKPYKCQATNFLCCVNEIFLLVLSLIFFAFKSPGDPNTIQLFGFIASGCLIVFFLINWAVIFPLKIKDFCTFIKKKCRKKTPDEIEHERRKEFIKNHLKKLEEIRNNSNTIDSRKPRILAGLNEAEFDRQFREGVVKKYTPSIPIKTPNIPLNDPSYRQIFPKDFLKAPHPHISNS